MYSPEQTGFGRDPVASHMDPGHWISSCSLTSPMCPEDALTRLNPAGDRPGNFLICSFWCERVTLL